MASRVSFNEHEFEALWGLPWLPQLVYMRAIRPNMDYASGVVGIRTSRTKRISYQAIREQVEVHETQGRNGSEQPSMSALRHAVNTLVKVGLLSRVEGHGDRSACLVFRCLLADVDSSVRNKYDRGVTGSTTEVRQEVQQEVQQGSNTGEASIGADSQPESQGSTAAPTTDQSGEVRQANPEKFDTPPDPDLKTYTHKPRTREREPVPADFSITAEVKARLFRAMVPIPFAEQLVQEFVNANESSGFMSQCWDAEFVKYCIQQKRYKESWQERNKPKNGLRLVASKAGSSSPDEAGHGFNTED